MFARKDLSNLMYTCEFLGNGDEAPPFFTFDAVVHVRQDARAICGL